MRPKNSPLTATVYAYTRPVNAQFSKRFGRRKFGSQSAYIDQLIAADRKRVAAHVDRRYAVAKRG